MAAPAPEDNKQEGEAYFDSQASAAVPTKDIEESSQTGLELFAVAIGGSGLDIVERLNLQKLNFERLVGAYSVGVGQAKKE